MTQNTIIMECCDCGKKVVAPRAEYDPPSAVRCVNWCEECCSGGKTDVNYYYDANGNDVSHES